MANDQYLQCGPYNWGWRDNPIPANNKPNLAEHFPYQQGVLVTYVDTSVADNNTSTHPGSGMALVVDAHHSRSTSSTGCRGASGFRSTTPRSASGRQTR
jgi:immune inhibitor A